MELSKFENGIATHNAVIQHVIDQDSVYVMHEDGYSYTVGMRHIRSPELIIFGQSNLAAEELFKIIYIAVEKEIGSQGFNAIVKNIFEPALGLLEMTEKEKKELFYAVRTYYDDWSFDALKLTMNNKEVAIFS